MIRTDDPEVSLGVDDILFGNVRVVSLRFIADREGIAKRMNYANADLKRIYGSASLLTPYTYARRLC